MKKKRNRSNSSRKNKIIKRTIEYSDSLITLQSLRYNQHTKWKKATELSWKKYYKENYDKKKEQNLISYLFRIIKKCAISAFNKVNVDSTTNNETSNNINFKSKKVPIISSRAKCFELKSDEKTSITSYNNFLEKNNDILPPIEVEVLSDSCSSFCVETSKPENETLNMVKKSKEIKKNNNRLLYKTKNNFTSEVLQLKQKHSVNLGPSASQTNHSIENDLQIFLEGKNYDEKDEYFNKKKVAKNYLNYTISLKTTKKLSNELISFGSSDNLYRKYKRYHKDFETKKSKKEGLHTKSNATIEKNSRLYKYEIQCLW